MLIENQLSTRFPLGQVLSTPGAFRGIPHAEAMAALARHADADWGDVSEADRQKNDLSLERGHRLMSVYRSEAGTRFWIITEADRSVTTILLPHEY